MKKAAAIIIATIIIILIIFALQGCRSLTTEELRKSIEVIDLETKWISKYYQPWPPRLILVPQISFRIKNVGTKPLTYINFNAIFNFKGDPENLGDSFLAAIRSKPVNPGETSNIITLTSNFGVEGKSVKQIDENPAWRQVEVRLFARSRGSEFAMLGVYDIAKIIDFKEPEPVEPQKKDGSI